MTRPLYVAALLGAALSLLLGAACPRRGDGAATVAPPAPAASAQPMPPPEPPPFAPQPPGARVALLYTASVEGYVAPCGCTADPLGGVARLAGVVDAARAAYGERVVFVDAGDLLFEAPDDNLPADACQAEARVDLLLGSYARKGLVATALGTLDDARGAEWRDQRLQKHGIVTVGVPDAGRALLAGARHLPGVVVDAGGVKVGVTGFRADDEARAAVVRGALAAEVERLYADGAVTVVALAQAPAALVPRIASDIPGLDVVVQGRRPGELPREPQRLDGGAHWVAAGAQAQHVGVVELALEGREGRAPLALDDREGAAQRRARLLDARIAQYEKQAAEAEPGARRDFVVERLASARAERARVVEEAEQAPPPSAPFARPRALPLPRTMPEEPTAKAALDAYDGSIRELVARCEEHIRCPAPEPGEAVYVGVEACFSCHRAQVQLWQSQVVEQPGTDEQGRPVVRQLSHARAWDTLVEGGKDKDRSCVGCHSIGFNEPGGYCKTSEVEFRKDVQCESCHGPGSLHAENGDTALLVVKEVGEATCRRCHHVPHIPTTESFVFEEKLRHVLGDGHGKARLDELSRGKGR